MVGNEETQGGTRNDLARTPGTPREGAWAQNPRALHLDHNLLDLLPPRRIESLRRHRVIARSAASARPAGTKTPGLPPADGPTEITCGHMASSVVRADGGLNFHSMRHSVWRSKLTTRTPRQPLTWRLRQADKRPSPTSARSTHIGIMSPATLHPLLINLNAACAGTGSEQLLPEYL